MDENLRVLMGTCGCRVISANRNLERGLKFQPITMSIMSARDAWLKIYVSHS